MAFLMPLILTCYSLYMLYNFLQNHFLISIYFSYSDLYFSAEIIFRFVYCFYYEKSHQKSFFVFSYESFLIFDLSYAMLMKFCARNLFLFLITSRCYTPLVLIIFCAITFFILYLSTLFYSSY